MPLPKAADRRPRLRSTPYSQAQTLRSKLVAAGGNFSSLLGECLAGGKETSPLDEQDFKDRSKTSQPSIHISTASTSSGLPAMAPPRQMAVASKPASTR